MSLGVPQNVGLREAAIRQPEFSDAWLAPRIRLGVAHLRKPHACITIELALRGWGDLMKGSLAFVVGLVLSINVSPVVGAESGTLKLTIRDAATGELVPARLQVKDVTGMYRVANDAMMFGGDCDMSDAGAGYTNLVEALRKRRSVIGVG